MDNVEIEIIEPEDELDLSRKRMRELYRMSVVLLSKPERLILYKILKDYRFKRDLVRLVLGLNVLIRTNSKLELLKHVRYFIWEGHLRDFDRLTKFHEKFRLKGHYFKSGTNTSRTSKYSTLNSNFNLKYGSLASRDSNRRYHVPGSPLLSSNTLQVPQFEGDRGSLGSGASTAPSTSRAIRDVRVFTIVKSPSEPSLGFAVRGGSEHGLGVYVSEVDPGSAAEQSGLQVGDKILEVNNITMRGVASSTAVKVLTGSKRLKLVVQRTRKVPEWRLSREKTSWYDVHDRRIISGDFEECGISNHIRGLDVDVPERRINLKFGPADRTLGFNIRGGREYGLGIYVSKLDRNGLADKNGVRTGDQIIDVNGIPFDNITHEHAVEVLKGKRHLILTLRDVGRFPVFKELYAEYTWSDGQMKTATSVTSLRDINVIHSDMSYKSASAADLFSASKLPSALQTEIFLPSDRRPSRSLVEDDGDDAIDNQDSQSDSESLDLEQWANDLHNEAGENRRTVTVHVEDFDASRSDFDTSSRRSDSDSIDRGTTQRKVLAAGPGESEYVRREYAPNATHEVEFHDYSNSANESIYEDPDAIYAKINKRDERYASTCNLSIKPQSGGTPDSKGSANYSVNISLEHIGSPTHSGSQNSMSTNKSSENRVAVRSEDHVEPVTASVDGALYAKVRKLSVGSLRNVSYSPELSPHKTRKSMADPYNDDKGTQSLLSERHDGGKSVDAQTLDIRRRSVSFQDFTNVINVAEDVDDDDEDDTEADEKESREYITADAVTKSLDLYRESGTGMLDLETLEEKWHELQARQEKIGHQELGNIAPKSGNQKTGTWRAIKKKIKGSLRLKSSKRLSGVEQIDDSLKPATGLFRSSVKSKIDPADMTSLEDAACHLLNEDEFNAVFRHIKTYHTTGDLERLVELMLTILDKPEKLLLLKDIRRVVYLHDVVQYDNLVNRYEIEAYQTLSMKLHLPLNHRLKQKPRRTLITTEMADGGHFHIKSMNQSRKEAEIVDIIKASHDGDRGERLKSPIRLANSAQTEVKSALDHFEYLDLEQSEAGSSTATFSDFSSHGSNEIERVPGSVVVHLSKTKPSIGIEFAEEVTNGERAVAIARIDEHGAAHDDSHIEVGMVLLGVDRHRVEGFTKDEVLAVLDKVYAEKHRVSMKLLLHKPETTHF
ncbi:uncharacterized protein LOC127857219 [Dreissena polymorpha]|uniref:PDZ domain-containing protein n=1 Tax=Dreissena polymorpha TaxID=45954 RepID=A0A9D3YXP8_DREPO|nr:uncharacterized protein LOC127857219 [Dreissena polymorpha]KAH3708217.1 hypothetical protein DPMN_067661 [Dreissena polymorpha]